MEEDDLIRLFGKPKQTPREKIAGVTTSIWRQKFQLLLMALILLLGGIFLYWVVFPNNSPTWTGFGAYDEKVTGPRAKTLWDWMKLLLIPAMLAIGAWWLNKSEKEAEQKTALQRANTEREIETDRQRQATLETYLDRMTNLLLEKGLRASREDDNVRTIARSHTLAVLRSLDGERKGQVIQFLYESGLISEAGTIDLTGANLRGINLNRFEQFGGQIPISLNKINLSGASLVGAKLDSANLIGADLSNTDLSAATLMRADLSRANLTGANLLEADLWCANLKGANLRKVRLSTVLVEVRQGQWGKEKRVVKKVEANLHDSDLSEADLTGAEATPEQLTQARSLDGATMPVGEKYDKSKAPDNVAYYALSKLPRPRRIDTG